MPDLNLTQLLEAAFDLAYFHADEGEDEPAIPSHWVRGTSPLVIVVGENASGKSFLRRIIRGLCKRNDVECIPISMEGRTDTGMGMMPIARALVYGDETYNSTGQLSAGIVQTGLRTCASRDKPHYIYFDEPDFGLSDGWAAGLGVKIREFVETGAPNTQGIFVVTHRRAMVREMMSVDPHYIHLGTMTPPLTLSDWVNTQSAVRNIEELSEISQRRFKRIQAILNQR